MKEFIGSFNNREIAIVIWIILFLFIVLVKKSIRVTFLNFVKICLSPRFIVLFVILVTHILLVILYLIEIGFWKKYLLKDTIIWTHRCWRHNYF